MRRRRTGRPLRAIQASAGIRAEYQRRLRELIADMQKSVLYAVTTAWNQNADELAQDALPSAALQKAVEKALRTWERKFKKSAEKIARWFAKGTGRRIDGALKSALDDAGFTVDLRLTRAERDALRSIIINNTNLIKSIHRKYADGVQEAVQRCVQSGGDLAELTAELRDKYGATQSRAVFIARDQNQKASQALMRVRSEALGITEGVWVHVPGRKMARESHMHMDGRKFKLSEGLYDSAEKRKVKPGELPGCMCTYRAVIPAPDE